MQQGWPESTAPGDEWRLQLWPARNSIHPRRLRTWRDREEALAMEGSGWAGDLDQLRAPDEAPG